jgi:proteasome component ECM29
LISQVMEMLSHINKRVKDQTAIQLPLRELLKLYISADSVSMVKNFALVYIEMAYDRAPVDEQTEVIGSLLLGLAKAPTQHQDMILRMAGKGLDRNARNAVENSWTGEFMKDPASCEVFLTYCLHVLLYQALTTAPEGVLVPPPGLSVEQAKQVMGKEVLKGEPLITRKLGVLNYLGELDLPADSVYPLYLVAAADGNERVSRRGEELLKRKANGANLEDLSLIKQLFAIFQGMADMHDDYCLVVCGARCAIVFGVCDTTGESWLLVLLAHPSSLAWVPTSIVQEFEGRVNGLWQRH